VSSLLNFGGPDENHWLTFHQIGNGREHDYYWYLTEIYHATPARPALNGEPYYSGMADKRYSPPYRYGAPGGTEADDRDVRSGIYGSFLSGGFGGHILRLGRHLGRGQRARVQPVHVGGVPVEFRQTDDTSAGIRVERGAALRGPGA